ncbi:hypothetical protein G7046_g7984 [Stylonectria norvegica]|nr:hypothetical protein G7046_g7984 [Stylonectria norvegica]
MSGEQGASADRDVRNPRLAIQYVLNNSTSEVAENADMPNVSVAAPATASTDETVAPYDPVWVAGLKSAFTLQFIEEYNILEETREVPDIQRNKVKTSGRVHAWTETDRQRLLKLRKCGATFDDCAKALGRNACSCSQQYNIMRERWGMWGSQE